MLKRLIVFALAAVAVVSVSCSAATNAAPKAKLGTCACKKDVMPSRIFVMIHKFTNMSIASGSDIETLHDRVRQCVAGTRMFEVIDRSQIKIAMKETNLADAGISNGDVAKAPERDNPKAASYMILGSVLSCGMGSGGGLRDGAFSVEPKGTIEVQVRIVDCKTGMILAAKSVIGTGFGKEESTAGFSPKDSGVMRDAIDEAAHMIADALRNHFCPAKIISVVGGKMSVNMTDEEVKSDDIFEILKCGAKGSDPDTGASSGMSGKKIGRVKITAPGSEMSTAEVVEDPRTGKLDLEKLDLDRNTYMLRRVSKATLKKESEKECR